MSHLAQLTIESQGLVSHDTTTTHHALQWTVEKEGVTVHFVKVKGHMDKYEFLRLLQRLQTLHHGLRPRGILTKHRFVHYSTNWLFNKDDWSVGRRCFRDRGEGRQEAP